MTYIHTDIFTCQSSKHPGNPCGDVFGFVHDADATTIILSDGLGAGIKANIAAEMCVARFLGLIKNGASLRDAFSALVKTMNNAWGSDEPFAVFSVGRILNNGSTTVLSYESPLPILITENTATVLSDRVYTLGNAVISENNGNLSIGEGILLLSDGITQAGLGQGLPKGWEVEGVAGFINKKRSPGKINGQILADDIHQQAKNYWGRAQGDDCSVLFVKIRKGVIVNLLSGPPINKQSDNKMIDDFMATRGIKVICGGTTSQIASRILNKKIESDNHDLSAISPPGFQMEGIHLVTEGIVTLNQVYNLLDEEMDEESIQHSAVFELIDLLKTADRINLFIGKAVNPIENDIAYKQQGILSRKKILQLIEDKLIGKGKLVVRYGY